MEQRRRNRIQLRIEKPGRAAGQRHRALVVAGEVEVLRGTLHKVDQPAARDPLRVVDPIPKLERILEMPRCLGGSVHRLGLLGCRHRGTQGVWQLVRLAPVPGQLGLGSDAVGGQ